MKILALALLCPLLAAQAPRPSVAIELASPESPDRKAPVDATVMRADLESLLLENGLSPAQSPQGQPRLVIDAETFRLPRGISALSVQALLEEPGRNQVPRARIVAALRGDATLAQELRQAVVDAAAALLGKGEFQGNPVRNLRVAGAPAPITSREVDLDRLRVLARPLDPAYPTLARNRGIQGIVTVRLRLDASGAPLRADLVSGPQELSLAALHHAMLWRFAPPVLPTGVSEVTTTLRVPFSLSRGIQDLSIPYYDPPRKIHDSDRQERD